MSFSLTATSTGSSPYRVPIFSSPSPPLFPPSLPPPPPASPFANRHLDRIITTDRSPDREVLLQDVQPGSLRPCQETER